MKFAATVLAGAFLIGMLTAPAARAEKKHASVQVVNKSDWEIHHFYLSSSDDDEWGPDQLGKEVIGADESFTLKNIPCDTYDVKLVDEDDDECTIEAVDLCSGGETWTITSKILLACQAAG
jgi:hypothetical protein